MRTSITHTPGAANDEGRVQVNALLAVDYANATSVTIDGVGGGADQLIVLGTAASDTFGVAGVPTITLNNRINVSTREHRTAIACRAWAATTRSTSRELQLCR